MGECQLIQALNAPKAILGIEQYRQPCSSALDPELFNSAVKTELLFLAVISKDIGLTIITKSFLIIMTAFKVTLECKARKQACLTYFLTQIYTSI